ncbi:MAG: TlpA disulfide reductase family protein [Bacteriovoracaceae bacterium]|nr:TlpA family protein disulfide reductase [Bacteroidota bacterium]
MSFRIAIQSQALLGFIFFATVFTSAQSVQTINQKGLDSLIAQRNGTILLLNVWATWCIPCKEEFPDLVKLSKEFGGSKVAFAAISVDFPDEIDSKVTPFVKKMKTPFPVFVADFPSQDAFINSFDKEWGGAVPATFIYDKNGVQQKYLLGKQRYDQLKKAIEDVTGKR